MAKRSRQLLSIVGIQLLLGGVYAWSAFVPALRSGYGFSSAQTQTVFGLTIGVLCIFSLFSGYLTTRSNPRDLFRAAGILLTLSYLGAGRYGSSYALLLLFISLLGGAGVACGYLCSLATVLRAYPDRQGLASGVVVAGYGAGAILLSAVAQFLLSRGMPVLHIFYWVGAFYGPSILLLSLPLSAPARSPGQPRQGLDWTLWKDPGFLLMAAGMFAGSFAALALIGNLKPLALASRVGAVATALVITSMSVGNVAGRLSWGHLLDQVGDRKTLPLLFLSMLTALILLYYSSGKPVLFLVAAMGLGFSYGGFLAVYPAQTARLYGAEKVGMIYPFLLLVHGAAALLGPWMGGKGYDRVNSFNPAIQAGFLLVTLTLILHLSIRKTRSTGA